MSIFTEHEGINPDIKNTKKMRCSLKRLSSHWNISGFQSH